MSSSSEHLQKKRFNIQNSLSNNLLNSSILRQTKTLVERGQTTVTINPDLFNKKIKYSYSINDTNNSNQVLTQGGSFPLLLYNSTTQCSIENISDEYGISKINSFLEYLQNDEYDKVFSVLTTDETQKILYDLYDDFLNLEINEQIKILMIIKKI